MDNILGFLMVCVFAGLVWVLLGKIWDWLSEKLKNPISYILPGLAIGVILAVLSWFCQGGDFGDLTLWGFHPFWVGFVPTTAWMILR